MSQKQLFVLFVYCHTLRARNVVVFLWWYCKLILTLLVEPQKDSFIPHNELKRRINKRCAVLMEMSLVFAFTIINSQMSSVACIQSVLHRDGSQLAKGVKHTQHRIALTLALRYGEDMHQAACFHQIYKVCVCHMCSNPWVESGQVFQIERVCTFSLTSTSLLWRGEAPALAHYKSGILYVHIYSLYMYTHRHKHCEWK